MRIDGSGNNLIPTHIARAYGVPSSRPVAPLGPMASTSPLGRVGPTAAPTPTSAGAEMKPGTNSLIAGMVRGPIEFDGVSVPRPNSAALNLYTRAADKIEAATAVQIGRTIDIKG